MIRMRRRKENLTGTCTFVAKPRGRLQYEPGWKYQPAQAWYRPEDDEGGL